MRPRIEGRTWKDTAIRANYRPSKFARLLGLHPRTLQRRFRQCLHRTPEQWLNELRLHSAARLARDGTKSKDIAETLDFKSIPSSCRNFKQFYGKTPSQLRRKKRRVAHR